ncbi:MAG: hypothetical protein ABH884_00665 [Candidatus Komeilibacteria bacterium]
MSDQLNDPESPGILEVRDQEGNVYGQVICSVANGKDLDYLIVIEDDDYKSLYPLVQKLQNSDLCLQQGDKKIICRFEKR